MLSDHAIFAAMYRVCRQYGIRHILSGTNYATGKTGSPLDFVAFHAKGSPRVTPEGHVRMASNVLPRLLEMLSTRAQSSNPR